MTAIALTIAGSDSSGGAGIQADLKTFSALHVYGASVITALTAQNTQGVDEIMVVPPEFVLAQMRSVMGDLAVNAIKIGMLGTAGVIDAVVEGLSEFPGVPVVLDPVMVATSGDPLLDEDAVDSLREKLIPLATLITPNLKEAALLLGEPEDRREKWMEGRAERLLRLGRTRRPAERWRLRRRDGTRHLVGWQNHAASSMRRASRPRTLTAPAARCLRPSPPSSPRACRSTKR